MFVAASTCDYDSNTYNVYDVISFTDCRRINAVAIHRLEQVLPTYESQCLPGGVWSNPPQTCQGQNVYLS